MKINYKKITAVLSSVVMLGSTMGVAAAANYPAPFVAGGEANVAIVYGTGTGVSVLDAVQAGNIQTNLQAFMGSGTSTTGGSVSGGDSVILAKASDNLNMADTWGTFTGTVDDDDLSTLLADGTFIADDNDEFDYEQKITLGSPTLAHFRDSDYEDLVGLDGKTPTVGFKLSSSTFVMNYTLDFLEDAESDIVSGDMDDIEGADLPLMGKTYYVSDLTNGTNANVFGKLTLLDSANTGSVSEGETVTVTEKEVSINWIDNDEVVFNVDGERAPASGKLTAGQSYKLDDGSYIGVRDISKLEVSGELGSATFSIGSGKLEITSGSDVKMNDDTIQGVKGWVYRGTNSASAEKIDKITIEWKTDEEEFLSPEAELTMPGFEAVKFSMGSFLRPEEEKITIEKDSDTSIEMTVPIKDGEVSFNLLYSNATGELAGLGKSATEQLATGESTLTFNEKESSSGDDMHSYFIASYNLTQEAESYKLRAKISYDSSNSRNETTIEKETSSGWTAVCEEKTDGDTCDIGQVSFTITDIYYKSGGNESVTLTAAANTNFNTLYTAGGLKIWLPLNASDTGNYGASSPGAINFTHSTTAIAGEDWSSWYLRMDSEDKDDNIGSGNAFNFTINDNSDNNLQVQQVNGAGTGGSANDVQAAGLEIGDTSTYETYLKDAVATRILHYTNPDEDYVEIYYPTGDSESYAEVYLTEADATITAGTSATSSATELGDVLVKDSEVSSVSSKNLVIVGGSCINSAAAKILGGAYCGAAFTEATGVGSGQFLIKGVDSAYSTGKIALVVAGYDVADTQNAAKYLTTQTVDTSKEYKGTSATSAEIVTAAAE